MFLMQNFFKGQLKMMILEALQKEPMHGYKLMQSIGNRCMNLWKPTAGALYPALKELKKEKMIVIKSIESQGRKKKVYAITETGKKKVKEFTSEKAGFENGFKKLLENPEFAKYDCDDFLYLHKIMNGIFENDAAKHKTTIFEFAFLAKQGKISKKQKMEFKKALISFLEKTQKINNATKK